MTHPHDNPCCSQCGDELKKQESGVCWTCQELENNRRRRLHLQIGEYAPEHKEVA